MISSVNALLSRGGFVLRKWAANDPHLLEEIDPSNHGHAVEHTLQSDDSLKVLGIRWLPLLDQFQPFVKHSDLDSITKRTVLSTIARLYDPLGWLSPVVVRAKIFMQRLWELQVEWDEPLSDELTTWYRDYFNALPSLERIFIPRWTGQDAETERVELHAFSDASTKAYATCIYIRTVSKSGDVRLTLLASKTRVAPLRQISVPRLELCGALLLADTLATIASTPEYRAVPRYCWTDSTIVLAWLNRPSSSYETFVANRVSKIHSSLEGVTWRHVRSADNPADLASRGLPPELFVGNTLWWNGPSWLSQSEEFWPNEIPSIPDDANLGLRATTLNLSVNEPLDLSFADRFSSWPKMLRVIALILRWSPAWGRACSIDRAVPVSAQEIRHVKLRITLLLQRCQFPDEIVALDRHHEVARKSPLASLNPFLDQEGAIRVGGRLRNAALYDDARHPLVLRVHPITRLIVTHAHEQALHGSISLTLSILRSQFWVLQAKRIIRSVTEKCVPCARIKAVVIRQLMGALPAPRVLRPDRPFQHCGIDYAGPVQIRLAGGRGARAHFAYIALFVCLAVKAIHIEIVSDYSAPAFVAAFHRFCSRRGLPSAMYSDQGTTFKGADRELHDAFMAATRNSEFQARLASDQIAWHFVPPAAPHFGGLWEAGVKSVKTHLKRVLADRTPTFEELATLTCRIEACLNSRPLSPLSDSADSLDVLTPGHFLTGGLLTAVPQPSVLDTSVTRLSRWQSLQHALESFWRSWADDYVRSLQSRTKWKFRETPIRVGQIVLLRSDNLPPTKWRLGRVTRLHSGDDGLPRVATVRTATSEYVRAISKLALLPVHCDSQDVPSTPPT